MILCPRCKGIGMEETAIACRRCRGCSGSGRVPDPGPYKVVGHPTNAVQSEAQEAFSPGESEDKADG